MTVTLPRRAFLGAELPDDREAFTADGVLIASVAAGSMAAHADLGAGDVLVSLAGLPVRDLGELAAALRQAGRVATTELAYVRAGVRHAVTVDITALPPEPGARYEDLAVDGARLRTIETMPASPRGLIAIIAGIACESIEGAPFTSLVAAWTRAGYATLRFDKRGIGDSDGGPCRASDFHTELADARAAVELARTRSLPLVIFGHSVGGIIAALLAPVAHGLIVYGTPVMRWIECLIASTRRQLELRGASADHIEHSLAAIRALARTGELNGRSAAYHAQLDAIDLVAAWRAVTIPVLVARGGYDWVVSADEQARIATLARDAELLDLPALDHLLGRHADRETSLRDYGAGASDDSLALATLPWLDRLVSRP